MIKIYIPILNKRKKEKIRGLFKNKKGKLFYDYLIIQKYKLNSLPCFYNHLLKLKQFYKQECFFYTINNEGFIFYNKNKIEKLKNKIVFSIGFNRKNLKLYLKEYLKKYKGLTIYKEIDGYKIEVYFNDIISL